MAASKFALIVGNKQQKKTTASLLQPMATGQNPDAWSYLRGLSGYFASGSVGSHSLNVIYTDGLVFATGTVTFSGDVSNADTLTIGGIVITFVTGTPNANQVKCGISQAATMLALVTYINASSRFIGMITATLTSSTVVTLQAAYPGLIGNAIRVTKSAANISAVTDPLASGATTNYSSAVSAGL